MSCSCHKEHLICTSYCNYCGEDGCYNPYTQKIATTLAADLEMDEAEEQDIEDVEGVGDAEEQSEEVDEYNIETEFIIE